MNSKLTLKLDSTVIEKAKNYAEVHKTSLSKLIESYLRVITTKKEKSKDQITPLVKSLSGVIVLPENFDERKEYGKHLKKKYS